MTMSFKQLIEEAAANKVALAVTTEQTEDGKTLATFAPVGEEGRSFTAEVDNYTARVTSHTHFGKTKSRPQPAPAVKPQSAPAKKAAAAKSPALEAKKAAPAPKAKKAAAATKKK